MPLNIPLSPRRNYRSPPLRLVICQVRFPAILSLGSTDYLAPFQEDIRARFPVFQILNRLDLQIDPSGGNEQSLAKSARFASLDDSKWITVNADSISFETSSYSSIDEFAGDISAVLESFARRFAPAGQVRFGLRYINELPVTGPDEVENWRVLLRPELLGLAMEREVLGEAVGTLQEMHLTHNDARLLLRHGLVNNIEGRRVYLLDLDMYSEASAVFSVESIISRLRAYNDLITQLFEWLITDAARQRFELIT